MAHASRSIIDPRRVLPDDQDVPIDFRSRRRRSHSFRTSTCWKAACRARCLPDKTVFVGATAVELRRHAVGARCIGLCPASSCRRLRRRP